MSYKTMQEVVDSMKGIAEIKDKRVRVLNETSVRTDLIDKLVFNAVFNKDTELRNKIRWLIRAIAHELDAISASIQGDHFQANAKKYQQDPAKEVAGLKALIKEAIAAGFYNIDIDTSTLVDLSKPDTKEQQRLNFEIAAELTAHIRQLEPKGVTISVGGEIGEVGGQNSTVGELRAFMNGYREAMAARGKSLQGISKISVQTGTTHGGVPLPDGTIAKVKLDFDTLEKISKVAIDEYGLSGAVQHGASTLPADAFDHFPRQECAEIHLATGFQNMLYDDPAFPGKVKQEIYD